MPPGTDSRNRITIGDGNVQSLAYGVGDSRFDIPVDVVRTIVASGTLTIDLFGGVDLLDRFGRGANFRKVKSLSIHVDDGGDSNGVRIGGAGSNAWLANFGATTGTWDIFPDGPPMLIGSPAGITVSSTSKNLLLTNRSSTSAVNLVIRIAGSCAVGGVVTGIPGMPLYA